MGPLNRACDVSAEDVSRFRGNAVAFVTGLKEAFPWMTVSPKLDVLMHHAADCALRQRGSLW